MKRKKSWLTSTSSLEKSTNTITETFRVSFFLQFIDLIMKTTLVYLIS